MSKKTKRMAMRAGAGVLTAAALAATGAYLLSDKKQRAKAKAWAVKARREIAANARRVKKMSETEYGRVVDRAIKRYGSLHNVNTAELVKAATDMKEEWKRLKKDARVIAKMAQGKSEGKQTKKTARRRKR